MWCSQFQNDPIVEKYNFLKTSFLKQVDQAFNRCKKVNRNKYNQERNFSVATHPEIENKIVEFSTRKDQIQNDIEKLECILVPSQRINYLINYANDIIASNNKSFFTTVLKGKLAKHWKVEADEVLTCMDAINHYQSESGEVVQKYS